MLARAFELCGGSKRYNKRIKRNSIAHLPPAFATSEETAPMAPVDISEGSNGHPKAKRRLILCFDGTWFNSISIENQVRDNISTIAQAILPKDKHGNPQIVYYIGGAGTGTGLADKLWGGASGFENKDYVKDGYMFIVNNYVPGETEIYIFGWSRGAYAARVTSAILCDVGLLKITGVEYFSKMFDDFFTKGVTPKDLIPEDQIMNVEVECVGVWETVGSQGVPNSEVLGWGIPIINNLIQSWNKKNWYQFLDSALPSKSKHALQAFAIDEDLRFLSPTLWYTSEDSPNTLKQVWFPGLHASLAGGYSPTGFGDISLNWMISEVVAATDLEFNMDFLLERFKADGPLNTPWGAVAEPTLPPQDRFAYAVGPKLHRKPHQGPKPPPGNVTNEFIHHSVVERMGGTVDGYPAGKPFKDAFPVLPYTEMEMRMATDAKLTTEKHVKQYWEPQVGNGV